MVLELIGIPNLFTVAVGILGTLFTVITFIEPIITPVLNRLFKQIMVVKRADIYKAIIDQFETADRIVRFKSPTTTWGQYSEGLKVFERTLEAIRDATSRGVEIRIITDLWDWERAKFALALIKSGAHVRYDKGIYDYFLVTDESQVITMGTERRAHYLKLLDREVKRLTENALISNGTIQVERAISRFDEQWSLLSESSGVHRIKELLSCQCQACGSTGHMAFREQRIYFDLGEAKID